MADPCATAAPDRLTVGITKIAGVVHVNVRDGVMLCPQCGDKLVEVSRDTEGVTYECRSDKAVMDIARRQLMT